jgi:protein BUR2
MLELLTFDVVLASPYNYLYQFIQKLQIEDNKPLRNAAWAFLNDSSLTMMCLLVPPQDIAVASIYFAARYTQTQIADNDGDPWWEQIGGRPEMITKAVAVINEFYSENPLKRSENPYEQSPNAFGHEDDLDRTRSTNESFREETPQSQRSQNGHHEPAGGPGSPTRNGAKQGDPDGQKPESPKGPVVVSTVPTDGSSNKPLKEAANYPATHEHDVNGRTNGTSELQNTSLEPASKSPAKRKELTSAGEPSSKRQKPESEESKQQLPKSENVDVPKANTAGNDEASEEGELEE